MRPRIYVKKASDFRALKNRLASRWLLNTFWSNSWWDKTRKIRTVDRWWQRCIDLLAASSEVILVDLSVVKAGTRWELTKICGEKLEEKTVCIVYKEQMDAAIAIVAEYWPTEAQPAIFTYNEKGRVTDQKAFALRIAEILTLPRSPYIGKSKLYFWAVFSLFTWPIPILGLLISVFAISAISQSEGRLKGKVLAQISAILSGMVIIAYGFAAFHHN